MKSTETPAVGPRAAKRVLRRALISVSVLVAVLVVLFLTVKAMFPAERLRELAVSRLEEVTGLDISVRDAGISFVHWRLGIKVSGVQVSVPGQDATLATIPEVGAVLAILPLLKREIVVDGVYVENAQVSVVTGIQSPGSPPRGEEKPIPTIGLSFQLPRAVVNNADITVRDARTGQEIRVENLDASSRMRAGRGLETVRSEGKFSVESIAVRSVQKQGPVFPEQTLRGTWSVTYKPEQELLDVQEMSLRFGRVPVEVTGKVDLSKQQGAATTETIAGTEQVGPEVDLLLQMNDVKLSDFISLAPEEALAKIQNVKAEGTLNVSSRVTGRLPRPEVHTEFGLVTGRATKLDGRALVKTAKSGTLSFESKGRLELGELQNLLPSVKGPRVTEGVVELDVKGSGALDELKADPYSIQLRGQVTARNVRIQMDQPGPPVSLERAKVVLLGNRAEVSETEVTLGSSRFDISGRVDDWKKRSFAIDVRSPKLDLKELLLPLSEASEKAAEKRPFVAPLPPAALGMEGVLTLAVGRITFGAFSAEDLDAKLLVGGDSLSVTEVRMKTLGGVAGGRGRLDLPLQGQPKYAAVFAARDVQLANLLDTLTPLKGLMRGATFFEIALEGRLAEEDVALKSVSAGGQLRASQVSAVASPAVSALASWVGLRQEQEYALKDFATSFVVQDGRLVIPECSLVERNSTWHFSGSTGFDGSMDQKVTVVFSPEYSARVGSLKGLDRLVKDEQGRIVVDVVLGGTVKKPALRWDTASMERRAREYLEGRVKGEIERQLEEKLGAQPDAKKKLEEEAARLKEEAERKGKKLLEDLLKKKK